MKPSYQLRGDGPSLNTSPAVELSWHGGEARGNCTDFVRSVNQDRCCEATGAPVRCLEAQLQAIQSSQAPLEPECHWQTGEAPERGLCRFLLSKGCGLSRKSNKWDRNNLPGQTLFQPQTEKQPAAVYQGKLSALPTWTTDGAIFMKDANRSWASWLTAFSGRISTGPGGRRLWLWSPLCHQHALWPWTFLSIYMPTLNKINIPSLPVPIKSCLQGYSSREWDNSKKIMWKLQSRIQM